MKKLGAEYARILRNEKIKIKCLRTWFFVVEKFSWVRFAPAFLAVSVFLILFVAFVLWLKVAVNVDFPMLGFSNPKHLEYMGQIGDFFGGVLNPLLSFMALIAVLFTIKMQSHELKEAREETRIANRIQDKQTAVFERQNFESVMFRLLDVHNRLTDRVRGPVSDVKVDGFEEIVARILKRSHANYRAQVSALGLKPARPAHSYELQLRLREEQTRQGLMSLKLAINEVMNGSSKIAVSQYYRNMYQLLKLIDNFKIEISDDGVERGRKSKRLLRLEYFQRRQYCNILRAQLSDDELKLLYFNCLTSSGSDLRYYVQKFSLLKHLDRTNFISGEWNWVGVYGVTAYADYENISDDEIRDFQKLKGASAFGSVFPHS